VDDRRVVRVDGGGAFEEGQRRQRLIVGRVLVEVEFIRIRHAVTPGWSIAAAKQNARGPGNRDA
jgi:hypothetical protein